MELLTEKMKQFDRAQLRAAVFDLDNCSAIYSKNAFERLYPASTTKVMTALIAIKYGNLADEVTVTEDAVITEAGATLAGIKPGDKLTMEQLLHISVLFQLFNLQTDLFLYLCLRIRTKSPDKFLYTVVHTLSERRTFCIIYIALQRIRIMDSHILQCHMYSPTHTSLFDHKSKSQCAHLFIQLSDMLCYVETNSS